MNLTDLHQQHEAIRERLRNLNDEMQALKRAGRHDAARRVLNDLLSLKKTKKRVKREIRAHREATQ